MSTSRPDGTLAAAGVEVTGGARDWRDHDWQLVHDGPQDPALHMAIDEVLLPEVAAGRYQDHGGEEDDDQ